MQNQHFCQCTHLVRSGRINKNIDFAWNTLAILVVLYNASASYEMTNIIKNYNNCEGVPCKINSFVNAPISYEAVALTRILILHGTPSQFWWFFIMLPLRMK